MKLMELENKGKKYPFFLTYKAKLEIDRLDLEKIAEINDSEIVSAISLSGKLNKDGLSDEEKNEIIAKISPCIPKITKMSKNIDPIELGYLLLKNASATKDITQEEYDELIESISMELGFEKMWDKFSEMHDKVFTLVEKVNTPKTSKETKKMLS